MRFKCGRVSSVCYALDARTVGPRRRIAPGERERERKKIFKSAARRLELETTFRRTRVCASGIAKRATGWRKVRVVEVARARGWLARGRGKNIQISTVPTRAGCDDAFVERSLGE